MCSTLQRTVDHLRSEKLSLEQKLQDVETELKEINDSSRQIQSHTIDENHLFQHQILMKKNLQKVRLLI